MTIDRRIVAILYHNGITDVNTIENFIGEHDNYYEVVIKGKLRKLKIPGYTYNEDLMEDLTQKLNELEVILKDITELNPETEEEKELIKKIDDEFNKLESFSVKPKEIFEQKTVEEELLEVEKSVKENNLLVTNTFEIVMDIAEETFEEHLQKNEKIIEDEDVKIEPKKEVKKPEVKKPEVKKPEVKKPEVKKPEVKVETKKEIKNPIKKIDNDLDDFINLA